MSAEPEGREAPIPEPEFAITGAGHVAFAASPTMLFSAEVTEPNGVDVQSIALTAQVMIDPARRGYTPETRERLTELFGPPVSGSAHLPSTSGLAWARVAATVPGFQGRATFGLEVPCTYDLEVAAAKYFYAITDGLVPLTFHFNGNIFYWVRSPGNSGPPRLSVVPVSWSSSAQYRMPVQTWRTMMTDHYPGGGWIRLDAETVQALNRRRADRGLPSFDACVADLLKDASEPAA